MLDLYDKIHEAKQAIAARWQSRPRVGIILGTGLGGFTEDIATDLTIPYGEIPHFLQSTVKSHAGRLVCGRLGGKPVLAMEGRFHYYEGYSLQDLTLPVRVMKALGCDTLVVGAGTLVLYFGFLRDTALFARTPAMLHEKLREFSLATPLGFVAFAVFITVFHSLLEEYYWRWFAFGWLRRRLNLTGAIVFSSLGFMAHHVIVLGVWFPEHVWTGVVPFALCVAGGGAVWAWLYERTGSVYGPWLSHLIVDAAMFVVGYDLFFVRPR